MHNFSSSFLNSQFDPLQASQYIITSTTILSVKSMSFYCTILFVSRKWKQLLIPLSPPCFLSDSIIDEHHRQACNSWVLLGCATFLFATSTYLQSLLPGQLTVHLHSECDSILPEKKYNKVCNLALTVNLKWLVISTTN